MINNIPKISVLVITYNQEDVISRAIESLLSQKEYIYEICVSDDCSKDRTWDILMNYDKKYPGLFKLNRNNPNLGIFENIEKTWTMPSGDIIYQLSGDDECGLGWFSKVIDYINKNQIDIENDAFSIYGDFKCIYPDGDSFVKRNVAVTSGISPLRLSYRLIIGNRGTCFSKNVLNRFIKVSQGRSYVAESAQDRQIQMFSKKSYYIPCVANIYYANIGVSGHMKESDRAERQAVEEYAMQIAQKEGFSINDVDKRYAKYRVFFFAFLREKRLGNFLKMIWWFIISIDPELGKYNFSFKRSMFAVARRIPHKKPICWSI